MTARKRKKPPMLVIGLTGGIGMGKSTAAQLLRNLGFPVYSADEAVHTVLKKGGTAVQAVAHLFPQTLKRGAIDRRLLGQAVFGQPKKLRQLERIIHPLIREIESEFLHQARQAQAPAAILEIPLLFETKADKRCDITICVSAPQSVQKQRVLSRPHMTKEKFQAILARQLPNTEKRRLSTHTLPSGKSIPATQKALHQLLTRLSLLSPSSPRKRGSIVARPRDKSPLKTTPQKK